jgi:hypothetical protein
MAFANQAQLPPEIMSVLMCYCTWMVLWNFTLASRTHRHLAVREIKRRAKDIKDIPTSIAVFSYNNRPHFLACVLNHVPGVTIDSSAIRLAAKHRYKECLELLLGFPGVTVEHVCADDSRAICWAAEYGRKECLELLLGFPGVTVEHVCADDSYAIRCAASNGHKECLELLLGFP